MKLLTAVGAFSSLAINARPLAKNYTNPSYRRSDHPSFGEKKHSLLIDSQGASNKSIETESGTLRFENGVAVLPDDSRAKDIYDEMKVKHSLHPNQYSLTEDKPTVNADTVHRYSFGWSRSFSNAWERVFGKTEDDQETEDIDGRPEVESGNHPDTA